jgi:biopolymer transport protein ExbD
MSQPTSPSVETSLHRSMKKCSRSAHESLTELNITPLLDLAFVLLVIFIITTIPPVKDLDLKLPTAAKHQKDPPRKANYISVQADGKVVLNTLEIPPADLLGKLVNLRMDDPDLNVIIRGDAKTRYKQIRAVLDQCQQANIAKVQLATEVMK